MAMLFPNPMSNDSVDKLNHKWMVLLFLVLSLASFIIPLHPSYREDNGQQSTATTKPTQPTNMKVKIVESPNVRVSCWCPAEFTSNYVDYANTICGKAYNAFLRGDANNSKAVYLIPVRSNPINVVDYDQQQEEYLKANQMKHEENQNRQKKAAEEAYRHDAETVQLKARVQKLVTYQTPLLLLLLAICLILPQLVWAFLSDCCSPFSISETLDAANRKRVYDELSKSIAGRVRSATRISSLVYLLKKILSVLVVIAMLLVTTQHALPEVEKLEKDIKAAPSLPATATTTSDVSDNHDDNTDIGPFMCDFSIRKFDQLQHWTLTCTGASTNINTNADGFVGKNTNTSLSNEENLLEFESTMLKIVMAFLAIVVVANVISLCSWMFKLLCASSNASIGLHSNAAMDLVLLLHMARINASVEVIQMLSQTSSNFNDGGFDQIGLKGSTDNQ